MQMEDPNAHDAACDGRIHVPEGNLDYRHPRSGCTHAMPHILIQLNPRGHVHRVVFFLPTTFLLEQAAVAAGRESRLLAHLYPVGFVLADLADGDPDLRHAAYNDRLPALQRHPEYRHPPSGWPHATPHLPT